MEKVDLFKKCAKYYSICVLSISLFVIINFMLSNVFCSFGEIVSLIIEGFGDSFCFGINPEQPSDFVNYHK